MKSFYDLKIATKLLISFAAVLVITAALGLFSIWQLEKVNGTTVDMEKNWLPSVRTVLEMKAALARMRVRELQHILSDSVEDKRRYSEEMKGNISDFGKSRDDYQALISGEKEKALYSEIALGWEQYLDENGKIMALSKEHRGYEAQDLIRGESLRLNNMLNDKINQLVEVNVEGSKAAGLTAADIYHQSRLLIALMIGVSIVIGFLLALWIARIVSRPLKEAVKVAQTVAAGDLTSRIDSTAKDETGQLLQALKAMNDSLLRIVGEVRNGTETIASASGQIASGNMDLSSRTEQQAGSLEETASSMEELTGTVKQNADNARQANTLAVAASQVAVKGGDVVAQVVDTMGSINDSSKKIVDIIAVIDGIAFQTNILALNAAVEAARAGEQGRGFAVVASEVRSLAQRSATAAKEIKGLIDNSVEKVDIGSKLVGQAGTTMQEIVESVRRVTDIIGEISAASDEQTSGIEQINQAITQMDEVTQQNAALVEEASAAAQALQDQAGKLAEAVSIFRIDGSSLALEPALNVVHMPPGPAELASPKTRTAPRLNKSGSGRVATAKESEPKKLASEKVTAGDDWEEF